MAKSTSHPSPDGGMGASKRASSKTRRRSAGEGSVYQTGTRWRGAVTWTDEAGTRHRRTVTSATSKGARQKLDKLREDLGLGVLDDGKPETLEQFLSRWILRYRTSVRYATWHQRENHVRLYLIPALGKVALTKLTAERIELALASFLVNGRPDPEVRRRGRPGGKPLDPVTVSHVRATLRRALADAEKDGKVGRNAASRASAPYVPRKPITYLSEREVVRMLEATHDDELGPLYALAVSTGLRRGELLGLAWPDVDGDALAVRQAMTRDTNASYVLGEPKSDASLRTISLPIVARQAIEMQRTRQRFARNAAGDAWQDRDGLMFTDSVGRRLNPEAVSSRFSKALRAAGMRHVPFHALRHTAATLMLKRGVPLAVISKILGHSSIVITAGAYAAVVPELHLEAAEAMDRALEGAS